MRSIMVLFPLIPLIVPPSPTKCLAQAATLSLRVDFCLGLMVCGLRFRVWCLRVLSRDERDASRQLFWPLSLKSRDDISHHLDDFRVFAVALVATTPSWITTDLINGGNLRWPLMVKIKVGDDYDLLERRVVCSPLRRCMEQTHTECRFLVPPGQWLRQSSSLVRGPCHGRSVGMCEQGS